MRIEFYRSFNPLRLRMEWRWRARATNGKIVANSGEGYVRKIDAEQSCRSLANRMMSAPWDYLQ